MRRFFACVAARASVLVLGLVFGGVAGPGLADAATKHPAPSPREPFAYNTSGVVGGGASPASVTGPAVLVFQGLTGATFDPNSGQPIGLGQFVVSPSTSATGAATIYNGTPFRVEIEAPEFNKSTSVPLLSDLFPTFGKKLGLKTMVENSLLLKGHLDGTVGANGQANVTATVDSIKLGALGPQSKDHVTHYTFPIRYNQLKLPATWKLATPAQDPSLPANSNSTSTGIVIPPPAAQRLAAQTIMPTPAPEPSTILMFATAFGGLVAARRRFSDSSKAD